MRRWSLAAFTFALFTPSLALAQSDSAARAQALFDQAVSAARAGDYPGACPKFAASQELDPKTSTLLNLASCYELNGQTASAWATFKEAEAAARKYGRKDWAERAANAIKALEPKLVRLTVHVPEVVRAPDLSVQLDGKALAPTEWEQALPVDPGTHRLDWSAPGHEPASRTVDVKATSMEATLPALERAAEPAAPVVLAPPRVERPAPFWTTGRTVGVVLGGVGVASAVAGSVFGVLAGSKYDDAERLCGAATGSPRVCLPERSGDALAARDDAGTRATASTALFIAGGVLAASGVALFLVSSPKSGDVALVPWQKGASVVGRF